MADNATTRDNTDALDELIAAVMRATGVLETKLGQGTLRQGGGGGVMDKALGGLSKMALGLVGIFGKVMAALGPIALIGAALGSATSGFSVFISAIQLIGATLGTLLLPVFVVLSAALVAVQGYLWEKILPVLGKWYQMVLDTAMAGVEYFTAFFETVKTVSIRLFEVIRDSTQRIADRVDNFVSKMDKSAQTIDKVAKKLMFGIVGSLVLDKAESEGEIGPAPGQKDSIEQIFKDIPKLFAKNLKDEQKGGASTGRDRFMKGMDDTLKEMRMNMGPKAQRSGLVDAWKQAQMTAMNMTPFQRKTLEMQEKSLRLQEETARGTRSPAPE